MVAAAVPSGAGTVPEHSHTLRVRLEAPVADQRIIAECAKHGPLGGFHWAASDTAFVVYMRRADSDAALVALGGGGVKVCGVAVVEAERAAATPVPAQPYYIDLSGVAPADVAARFAGVPVVQVQVGGMAPARRSLIDTTASFVVRCGRPFEEAVALRERENPHFAFLRRPYTTAEHLYYRWRLYSLSQGDTLAHWRTRPFQLFLGGAVWLPPPAERPQRGRGGERALTAAEKEELFGLLRGLEGTVGSVRATMVFCVEKAADNAAGDVAHVVSDALSLRGTPWAARLARLHLLSDVLFNAAAQHPAPKAPGAALRPHLERRLPAVMGFLRHAVEARMGSEEAAAAKRRVAEVLAVWRSWRVFPDAYVIRLQRAFEAE